MHKLTCRKRESVGEQHSKKNRRAVGLLNPMHQTNEGENQGGEGTTPVTMFCPEAVKQKRVNKKKNVMARTYCFKLGLILNVIEPAYFVFFVAFVVKNK